MRMNKQVLLLIVQSSLDCSLDWQLLALGMSGRIFLFLTSSPCKFKSAEIGGSREMPTSILPSQDASVISWISVSSWKYLLPSQLFSQKTFLDLLIWKQTASGCVQQNAFECEVVHKLLQVVSCWFGIIHSLPVSDNALDMIYVIDNTYINFLHHLMKNVSNVIWCCFRVASILSWRT